MLLFHKFQDEEIWSDSLQARIEEEQWTGPVSVIRLSMCSPWKDRKKETIAEKQNCINNVL